MSRKRPSGPIQPPDPQKAYRTGVGVVLALPIVLGVALSVLSPSHFRPLLASSLGLALLALGVVLEALGAGAAWWVDRSTWSWSARRFASLGITAIFVFPTLWILLVGPAFIVVAQHAR
ncbi:MAG: hypothetical protein E6J02_09265 [Chloroflexi bacterium]|nr:MAG: hypothetical protein E6J02_09265 [Chloroflexota bacterium]TME17710.1 MAG: hypothetical protein E6I63_02810 [Chloroflexota bacterium]TME19286.1 MAG: hypothetical protein E6I70_04855 [Chloroflexota bacterium]